MRIGNKVALAPGLDVRGEGGQVVAPGSVHASGRGYEWEVSCHPADVPLALLPQWLIALINTPSANGSHAPGAHNIREKIPEGERNNALFRYGCFLRARMGASEAEIYATLSVRNAEQRDPPLDDAEVRQIAKSAARYAPSANGGNAARGDPSADGDAPPKRRDAAARLRGYALSDPQQTLLFVDQHKQPHALVGGRPLPLTFRCYVWLRRLMLQQEDYEVGSLELARGAGSLAALAVTSGNVRELHGSMAWHNDALYVELDAGKVVRVNAGGWELDKDPLVLFRRFPNLKPLPMPERGGTLDTLLGLLPLRSERDKRLLMAYVVCGLLSHVPRPILHRVLVETLNDVDAG